MSVEQTFFSVYGTALLFVRVCFYLLHVYLQHKKCLFQLPRSEKFAKMNEDTRAKLLHSLLFKLVHEVIITALCLCA